MKLNVELSAAGERDMSLQRNRWIQFEVVVVLPFLDEIFAKWESHGDAMNGGPQAMLMRDNRHIVQTRPRLLSA